MKLIATLSSIDNLEEVLSLSDGIVVYTSDFSSFKDNGFNKNEIVGIINKVNKPVFINLEFMLEDDRIDEFTSYINFFKQYNPYFIVSDLGSFQILKENGLAQNTIYNPNTLVTNTYDLGFYLNQEMSIQISEEIMLKDQIKMINSYPNRVCKQLFGYHLMFHSKRHLISLYQEFLGKKFNIDNENSYLIEQTRQDKYHIVETKLGTSLYRPYVLDNSLELPILKNLQFGFIDDHFVKYNDYIQILKSYNLANQNMIELEKVKELIISLGYLIEDGFKYEDTIYQKELISCQ